MKKSLHIPLNMKWLIVLLLILMSAAGNAQNLTLTGKITGNKDSLLSGEVLIMDAKGTHLLKVSPFANGVMLVPGVHTTQFVVKIAAHGYPDTSIAVNTTQQTGDYGFTAPREL